MIVQSSPRIVRYPDPVLRRPAAPAPAAGPELEALADLLWTTCRVSGGAGLAAPQIGVGRRVAVVDGESVDHPEKRILLVNPELEWQDGRQRGEEGCLSFLGVYATVTRPSRIAVRTSDLEGTSRVITAQGLAARAICHEMDHLRGVLLPDRLGPLQRRWFLVRYAARRLLSRRDPGYHPGRKRSA